MTVRFFFPKEFMADVLRFAQRHGPGKTRQLSERLRVIQRTPFARDHTRMWLPTLNLPGSVFAIYDTYGIKYRALHDDETGDSTVEFLHIVPRRFIPD